MLVVLLLGTYLYIHVPPPYKKTLNTKTHFDLMTFHTRFLSIINVGILIQVSIVIMFII